MLKQFLQQLIANLKVDEGCEVRPYFDQFGNVTFGVGHNLVAHPLTREQKAFGRKVGYGSTVFTNYVLMEDIQEVERYLTDMHGWINNLPLHQQRALYNMAFQLGEREFGLFEPTWAHLRSGELEEVERHLKGSLWYRQTPGRAQRVINLLIRGEDYGEGKEQQ